MGHVSFSSLRSEKKRFQRIFSRETRVRAGACVCVCTRARGKNFARFFDKVCYNDFVVEVNDGSGFSVKMLADSISPFGARLVTMELTFPRSILAELNTHRMKSSNAASSRAIPIKTMRRKIKEQPFIPVFRQNKKGMQAGEDVTGFKLLLCHLLWITGANVASFLAGIFDRIGVHKQYANRLLEPWLFTTVIFSATDLDNFFHLRCDEMAEPSMYKLACMMREVYQTSTPRLIPMGKWHLPFIDREAVEGTMALIASDPKIDATTALQDVSAGKCARVSYDAHDGTRSVLADIKLANSLKTNGHNSPFEHQATPLDDPNQYCGNFRGWKQYRKFLPNENRANYFKDR